MAGDMMVVRHEAHTGLSATFSAATVKGAAVKVTGEKTVAPTAAATDVSVGVSHFAVAAGQRGTFNLKGDVIPMVASGAIAAGAQVEVAAAGRVATKGTGATFGVAWTAAAGAGSELLVIVL